MVQAGGRRERLLLVFVGDHRDGGDRVRDAAGNQAQQPHRGRLMAGAAARPRSSGLLPMVLGIVMIPAVLGSSQTIFNDGDVSWHIATGRWILSHGAIPKAEPFSFTWAGRPWVPIEWLSELIYGA